MVARELFNGGSAWTDVAARAAFPVLLRRAMDGDPITYGGLNDALIAQGGSWVLPIAYRYAAGKIGDICEALTEDLGRRIPPLNAIITNGVSGLPSHGVDGYLARFLGKSPRDIARLSQERRDLYARHAMDTVFSYEGWGRIGKHFGLRSADLDLEPPDRGDPIPLPDQNRFATGPETEAHKALKTWVANNPATFREYGKFTKGRTERTLSSGDRLDVLFDNNSHMLAVEVKAGNAPEAEVERGVYQCIKYRATLRAMQIAAARPPNGNAVLALDRKPPTKVLRLAKRLSVNIMSVDTRRG